MRLLPPYSIRAIRISLLLTVTLGLLAITNPEHSSDTCVPKDPSVRTLRYPNEIPEAVLRALKGHDAISPPGGAFNATDVVEEGVPDRRVLFAWNRGTRYLIATEQGGRSHTYPIFVYEVDQKNNTATLVSEQTPIAISRCESANSLIVQK